MPDAKKSEALDVILRDKMDELIALVEAMAGEEPDCDLKLAALLDGEPERVRIAIVEKLREMLKERAAEKENELDRILEEQKRIEVTHQRNVFMQWLAWIMSEETLRKIQMLFAQRPGIEGHIKNIGEDLAAKGVLTHMQLQDKNQLGELSANVQQQQGAGKEKDQSKGRS